MRQLPCYGFIIVIFISTLNKNLFCFKNDVNKLLTPNHFEWTSNNVHRPGKWVKIVTFPTMRFIDNAYLSVSSLRMQPKTHLWQQKVDSLFFWKSSKKINERQKIGFIFGTVWCTISLNCFFFFKLHFFKFFFNCMFCLLNLLLLMTLKSMLWRFRHTHAPILITTKHASLNPKHSRCKYFNYFSCHSFHT